MSTRLIVNGRTVFATADYLRDQKLQRRFAKSRKAEIEEIIEQQNKEPEPVATPVRRRSPFLPGQPFHCPADKVVYRIIARLNPAEGWVTGGVVMGWYGVDYPKVLEWVKRGLLDAAMEQGSPTKRFRVLDPAACKAEAKLPPAPAPKKGRGKKR
jgi:hypothetical protein